MPSFTHVEVTATAEVEFEVFCECGAHMCNETETRNSRHRRTPQVVVSACKRCIEAATSPLQERIAELEAELKEARE
jgi:hypothetical protein